MRGWACLPALTLSWQTSGQGREMGRAAQGSAGQWAIWHGRATVSRPSLAGTQPFACLCPPSLPPAPAPPPLLDRPAVNQALLCTALGLPPSFFRRFSQSNAAFTVLDFEYAGGAGSQRAALPPRVRIERMNQVGAPAADAGGPFLCLCSRAEEEETFEKRGPMLCCCCARQLGLVRCSASACMCVKICAC